MGFTVFGGDWGVLADWARGGEGGLAWFRGSEAVWEKGAVTYKSRRLPAHSKVDGTR